MFACSRSNNFNSIDTFTCEGEEVVNNGHHKQ